MAANSVDLAQTLSQNGLDLPRQFVQPRAKRASLDLSDQTQSIPFIDLSAVQDGDGRSVSEAIALACQEWGFFQVVNHGISLSLLEKVKKVVKAFLDLPMEEKQLRPIKYESSHPTGYGRLFAFTEDTILDWVDALIHYLAPPALKDEDYWPASPVEYRETIEAYGIGVRTLIRTLLGILSGNLGLNANHMENTFGGEDTQMILRVNYYPRCPQANLVMGLSPHSDGSAITVLLQDEVEGLQVKKDGRWCTVKPLEGALIVNMGDMMQLVSNGKYFSNEHRAVVSKDQDRLSIVVFYAPPINAVLGPIASSDDLPHYSSIKYGDYLANYMSKDLEGKARIDALRINGDLY